MDGVTSVTCATNSEVTSTATVEMTSTVSEAIMTTTSQVSNSTSEVTTTTATLTSQSTNQLTGTVSSTEVTEVKSTTTVITTTTMHTSSSEDSQSSAQNHTRPLTKPSGDCQANFQPNASEDAASGTKENKPKVVSLQSLIPNVKASTLQVGDKAGALAKVATSGAKTVLVVNRDGGKVMLQVAAQSVEKAGEDGSNAQEASGTASSIASGESVRYSNLWLYSEL